MVNRRILLRALIFLLPVMGALLALEYIQRTIPNNYTHKKQLLESRLPVIETLILGSSHTYLAINPDSLNSNTFNLAATAQTLFYDRFLLKKYADSMPSLRTVVLPVSYLSLGTESNRNPGDFNRSYHYAIFYGVDTLVNPLSVKRYSVVNLFTIKNSVDRAIAWYEGKDSLVEFRRNGWFATDEQKELEKHGQDVAPYHNRLFHDELIPVNTQRISDIISFCQKRNIKVVLISTPVHRSYMNNISDYRYETMLKITDSLSREYRVPYYNFTQDPRFTDEDFFDSNHLRTRGAAKFSSLLDSLIQDIYQ